MFKKEEQDNKNLVLDLQERNLVDNHANLNNLIFLKEKQKIIYWGIDCTGESLHIGHIFQIIQTFRFIENDFSIIILIGEATSLVGDSSDKDKESEQKKNSEIKNFKQSLIKQIKKIISPIRDSNLLKTNLFVFKLFFSSFLLDEIFSVLKIKEKTEKEKILCFFDLFFLSTKTKKDKILFLNNKRWLNKLSWISCLNSIGRKLTVSYLLSKKWVKKHLEQGLSYSSFSYSCLQAYDFFFLYKNFNCHGQIGGSDQWGNITVGLKLIHSFFPQNNAFAIGFPLLTNKKKEKISKSKKNGLFLNSSQDEIFDFFRNLPDETAWSLLIGISKISKEQIDKLKLLNNPPNRRISQWLLLIWFWFLNYRETENLIKLINKKKIIVVD